MSLPEQQPQVLERARPTRVLLCLAALLGSGLVGAAVLESYLPDPAAATGLVLDGEAWRGQGEGWALHLRPLDDAERLDYLRRTTGFAVDPFAGPAGAPPQFLSFLVELENRSSAPLVFEPRSAWLVAGADDVRSAIGLDDVRASYGLLGQDLPPAYERIRPALLESSRTLDGGEQAAGLLVFRTPLRKARRLQVDLRLVLPSGDVVRLSAPYRRPGRNR